MVIFVSILFGLIGVCCMVFPVLSYRGKKKMTAGVEVTATVRKVIQHCVTEKGEEEAEGDRYATVRVDFLLPDGYCKKSEFTADDPGQYRVGDMVECYFVDGRGGTLCPREEFRAKPPKLNWAVFIFGLVFFLVAVCLLGFGGYLPFAPDGFWVYLFILSITLPLTGGSLAGAWSGGQFYIRKGRMLEVEGEITGRRVAQGTNKRGRSVDYYYPIISFYAGKARKHEGSSGTNAPKWEIGDRVTLYYDEERDQTWMKGDGLRSLVIGLFFAVVCGAAAAAAIVGYFGGYFG